MKNRLLIAIFLGGLTLATPGVAQEKLTLGDLKASNAQRLSRSDLQSLVPEANVISTAGTSSTRRWKNEKSGVFTASSTNAGTIAGNSVSGRGTWSIDDEGRYCVEIDWPRTTEKWCRAIFRQGDAYYGVSSLNSDTGRAFRFEFRK